MKFVKRVLAVCTAVLMTQLPLTAHAASAPELPAANTAVRHAEYGVLSEAAASYYTGVYSAVNLFALDGAADASDSYAAMQDNLLFDTLHTLMTDTHIYYTSYTGYAPGSLAYYWNVTDASAGSEEYIGFYSDIPYYYNSADDKAFNMEREHIWPKSRASFYQKGGGADLHHLRPSVSTVNTAKSNHAFGEVSGRFDSGTKEVVLEDTVCAWANKSQDLFECKDDVKGDAARILLYVYCRWEQPNLYSDVDAENLPPMDSDDEANSGQRVIEDLDTLLQWMEEDPVDSWEMQRNDAVQAVQGNRNVFIDYPELAWKLFGREIPLGMHTPSYSDGGGLLTGDVNEDGAVNSIDATLVLIAAAQHGTGFPYGLSSTGEQAADVNADGIINAKDSTVILLYAAAVGTGQKVRITDFA